jgi:maleylpyruvate isomerase
LARLLEVVIHHVDLDISYEITDIDDQTAEWLLEWCSFRLGSRKDCPRLELTSDSGSTTAMGSVGEPVAVSGSSAALIGWLLGRTDASMIRGGEGLRLPAF